MKDAQEALEKKNSIKPTPGIKDINDPAILSTLVTVLVHKFGDVRLNVLDFADIPNEEYVSVYIDINTNDIVLSLDHTLSSEDPSSAVPMGYALLDDETYH